MGKRIYVGNLPFSVGQEQLKELFSQYGEIEEAVVVSNKFSGRSKGFGFVSFVDDAAADKAIAEMNKKEVEGRPLNVKEAIPFDENKPRRSFDRGRSGGRGGRFGGNRGGFNRGPRRDRNFNDEEPKESSDSGQEGPEMSEESSESEE
jgi:RNA recognition motif-containing protein